jgi:hypothetical protein
MKKIHFLFIVLFFISFKDIAEENSDVIVRIVTEITQKPAGSNSCSLTAYLNELNDKIDKKKLDTVCPRGACLGKFGNRPKSIGEYKLVRSGIYELTVKYNARKYKGAALMGYPGYKKIFKKKKKYKLNLNSKNKLTIIVKGDDAGNISYEIAEAEE